VPSQGKFSLGGSINLCLKVHVLGFDLKPCVGDGVVVSSRGVGFCTTVLVPNPIPLVPIPFIPVEIAAGYTWGGDVGVKLYDCDLSDFTEANPRGANDVRAASAGARQAATTAWPFHLARHLPSAEVRISGRGGPPSVTLSGPGGRTYSTANPPRDPRQVMMLQYGNTTLIALNHPAGGSWTITQNPGSTPITAVAYAHGLPGPNVKARVSGRGRSRTLTYTDTPARGRTITFVERGVRTYHILGTAHGARGRIRFTPGDGRAGRRQILALVYDNGIQTRSLVVARYSAPGPQRPARPARLKVTHKGYTLTASWKPVAGAVAYEVLVRSSDGGREMQIVRGHKASFVTIEPGLHGTVVVDGVSASSLRSAPARQRFNRAPVAPRRRPLTKPKRKRGHA
jgi:hypothetical protein